MNDISVTSRASIPPCTLASDVALRYKAVGQVRAAGLVQMEAQRVKIVDGGKLVIPAAMRRELGITTGDTVLVDVDDGELRVRSVPKALERARAILRKYVPEGVGLADELIAERRREAERE
ncbi:MULTISPECIES: AbrB/MazE/SpoVT family DNA-binding domain-containing protein [Sphingomonadaceae]|jgi:AbrB family looped-hinge helix DNA binding protein|uniref:AbrB family looped-hinge helix DNA binding protein n=1 Tax=Sphingomonas trueperi TaxID=53317 RepID=A0A7X6BEV5_9SPHN|nr:MULTISPECIES: AbrB/MazE/SpoVT family DNA-binding domain-containing protein [Sphingomonadaceae]MCM3681161.1 AbrB/MazE/SpoVT family DNA-binding domain-containing protein [Sphingomonas paucimobilis]NJC00054.1 AbrB family looped-hinge helix DNA binding protein [Sphingomonas trueperi]